MPRPTDFLASAARPHLRWTAIITILAVFAASIPELEARGGGSRGGGGARGGGSRGGGSYSRPSGGGNHTRSASRQSNRSYAQSGSASRQNVSRDYDRLAGTSLGATQSGSRSAARASDTKRDYSRTGGASQLPTTARKSPSNSDRQVQRPSQLPAGSNRPGVGERPSNKDLGNFLGVSSGSGNRVQSGRGENVGQRTNQVANRAQNRLVERPSDRANWNEWSANRSDQWQNRVNNRSDSWNQWQNTSQQRRDTFQQNRDQNWDRIESAREDRKDWRGDNREDWQNHREDLWEYRGNRAEEVWGNARDFYDDRFDDRWWGACGWHGGVAVVGAYPANPWWWWAPVTMGVVAGFVDALSPDPVYIDYGTTVVYQGSTVYVDQKPVPTQQYTQPLVNLAVNVEQPPPPQPPPAGQDAEWLPLGVFALCQEEKGDPVMLLQISVNRHGIVSGACDNPLTGDKKPIAGSVDKKTQNVAWRIGENTQAIYATSLANLTLDVSPVSIHFGDTQVQTWLLVRMPPPADDKATTLPEIARTPPPATRIPVLPEP